MLTAMLTGKVDALNWTSEVSPFYQDLIFEEQRQQYRRMPAPAIFIAANTTGAMIKFLKISLSLKSALSCTVVFSWLVQMNSSPLEKKDESDETGVWIGISGGVQHRYSWTKPQFEHDAESVRQKLGKPERGTGKGSISSFPERHPTPDYDYRGGHAGH